MRKQVCVYLSGLSYSAFFSAIQSQIAERQQFLKHFKEIQSQVKSLSYVK